ncbi:uncharacterized protein LOC120536887 [Polypterus senegalus]|uniref:uncharacterized protein LOC120536887 n=1 Tax=Polypterus senegalus TaxID=55291 RepID=UPI0019647825|nr:uncharacterized protein LOC120536887 [Polypterus senegalus]
MEPHATCGHESGTTVSEETSGGQSIMTGRTPKEAEDSPETDIKEYDEMFSSAKKHIEHVYQHTHGFKESLKNEIESAKEEIRDWSGDPLTKRLLYFMQVAFDYFINFLLESLSKNLGDVKKIQIKFEKILQDKNPDDLDIKTQQDLQLSSQSAPTSGLTQMEPHATCGHESGTTVSEETSGGQSIMTGRTPKEAEDSPETNVKEYNEMFSSAIKHIEYFLQHNELLKESLKNKIETVKREIHDHPAYSQTEDHLLCIQVT